MKLYNWKKFNDSVEDIHYMCKKYLIVGYTINEDVSIDVDGNVSLSYKNLTKLPLKFRNVSGNFNCINNELTTLEGSPISVGGSFVCNNNFLTTLEGSPKRVGLHFYCYNNQLTTLRGGPEYVGGKFYKCQKNKLIDVEGFPELWKGHLYIYENPVFEIIDLFPEKKWSKAVYLINEYGAIDGRRVNSYVLEEIFLELGLTPPEIKRIIGYEVV